MVRTHTASAGTDELDTDAPVIGVDSAKAAHWLWHRRQQHPPRVRGALYLLHLLNMLHLQVPKAMSLRRASLLLLR